MKLMGDVSKMTDIPSILSQVVSKVPDAQVCADLDATLARVATVGGAIERGDGEALVVDPSGTRLRLAVNAKG